MFNTVCVTARKLSSNFLDTIEKLAKSKVQFIILREKDLNENEYFELAKNVNEICKNHNKTLVIHKYFECAKKLGIKNIHLPFSDFADFENDGSFENIGTSVHSVKDAVFAESHGASYITAGHIFTTDCKKGFKPRGVEFLKYVCQSVKIPVYAIGGINENTVQKLAEAESKNFCGVCVMSGFMKCQNPSALINKIETEYFYMKKNVKQSILLYAITDRHWLCGRSLEEDVEKALKGGATMLQLREKNIDDEKYIDIAKSIHTVCQKYNVPLIINDNVNVCLKSGAEGVHLGQNDGNAAEARKILGNDKIIGVTARTVEQAVKAEQGGADYVGSGAVFGTNTKGDAVKISFDTLKNICSTVSIPVTAIGGITSDNVLQLKNSGVSGIAVVSGIFAADDIESSVRELKIKASEVVNGRLN